MMMKHLAIAFLGVALATQTAICQRPPTAPDPEKREKIEARLEQIKMIKMTEELDLSEDQSIRFFPRAKDFEKKMKEMQKQQRRLVEDMDDAIRNNAADKDLRALMDQYKKLEQDLLDARIKFADSVKDILSVQQQAKMLIFADRFPEKMRRMLDKFDGERPPMPPGMMDPGDDMTPDVPGGWDRRPVSPEMGMNTGVPQPEARTVR